MYKKRILEGKILKYKSVFPVILLTGARQVGKSTLLSHLLGKKYAHIVFDPVTDELGARRDPVFFLQQHQAPIILDEIQYAPELLAIIKKKVDQDKTPGQYFLTGSQNLSLLKSVSESLAGRAMVLSMDGMSLGERYGHSQEGDIWLERILGGSRKQLTVDHLALHASTQTQKISVFEILYRGGYPGILTLPNDVLSEYFASYVRTYVERDIRLLAEVNDQQLFSRFFALTAALTAQEINYSQLGRELGVTPQTATRWLTVLKGSYQWVELPAYHGNYIKRLSEKSKGYITDTGLACHLLRITSPKALSVQPVLGSLFETHVVGELRKISTLLKSPVNFYHWRCHSGAEVDVVIERDGHLWPIEIKCKSNITANDMRGLKAFMEAYPKQAGLGIIIACVEKPFLFSKDIIVIPYQMIS